MPASINADGDVDDADAIAAYQRRAPATLALHGGRAIVSTATVEPVEGSWRPRHVVVLQFDAVERARR